MVHKGWHLRDTIQDRSRSSLYSFQILLPYFTMLSFYIIFLIPSFLIYPYKLFSIQLGPSITYLAHTRLIVSFSLFSAIYCIYLRRLTKSLLFSIVFCQLLWYFYYSSFFCQQFLAIQLYFPYIQHILSSLFSINIYCIGVFSQPLFFLVVLYFSFKVLTICPLHNLSPSTSIQSFPKVSPRLCISLWAYCILP